MSGLFGLLDDVAALARLSAATGRATLKAAGVVIDDTAVTPQYVHGITAERELPIIWRIAVGSLRNKLVFILPVALLLSQFVPWLLTPILMLGALYLAYEGAEKVYTALRGHDTPTKPPADERSVTAGAIRTDFILSAEIMVIALDDVATEAFLPRLIILAVVGVVMTFAVYGVVAAIVKMDDVGLHLTETSSRVGRQVGRGLLIGMPKLLSTLSVVGMLAMLWVGGHILLVGSDSLGWHTPYGLVHQVEEHAYHLGAVGGLLAWLANTAVSAVIGSVVGAVALILVQLLTWLRGNYSRRKVVTPISNSESRAEDSS